MVRGWWAQWSTRTDLWERGADDLILAPESLVTTFWIACGGLPTSSPDHPTIPDFGGRSTQLCPSLATGRRSFPAFRRCQRTGRTRLHARSRHARSRHARSRHARSHHARSRHARSRHARSRRARSRRVLARSQFATVPQWRHQVGDDFDVVRRTRTRLDSRRGWRARRDYVRLTHDGWEPSMRYRRRRGSFATLGARRDSVHYFM